MTYFMGKICDNLDEPLRLGRRYPGQMQPASKPHKTEQFLEKGHPFEGHVITIQVMAVSHVSPAHQHPVGAGLQRP